MDLNEKNHFDIKNACELSLGDYDRVIDGIENWSRKTLNGVSFKKDLTKWYGNHTKIVQEARAKFGL